MSEIPGSHYIADDVIAAIVFSAAAEVSGIYLPLGIGNLAERFGKKQSPKGIRVEQNDDGVEIDIKVVADYGINIPNACKELQKKIAETVTELTGKEVLAVNVHVADINMQSVPGEKPPESE